MTERAASAGASRRMVKVGIVTKNKMRKSVVVRVARTVKHGMYARFVERTSRFMAHDETDACKVGDIVEIVESRPLSARKRWRVQRILRSAVGTDPLAEGRD